MNILYENMTTHDPNTSRRFERAKELILVNYRVVNFDKDLGDFDEGMTTSTVELSAGGMLLRMTENFTTGTFLDLRFKIRPEGKLMTVLSVVKRSIPGDTEGMFYVSVDYPLLSDEDRVEIDRYVREHNEHRG